MPFPREGRTFPKQCSCGAVYGESEWSTLPFHGIASGRDDSTGRNFGRDLEIRVCTCGSSMGQYVKDDDTQEPAGARA
jgi:hypothetical protein